MAIVGVGIAAILAVGAIVPVLAIAILAITVAPILAVTTVAIVIAILPLRHVDAVENHTGIWQFMFPCQAIEEGKV